MRACLLMLSVFVFFQVSGQELPLGYISYFKADFAKNQLNKNISFSGSTEKKVSGGVLSIKAKPDSTTTFVPTGTFIINNSVFGDFIAGFRIRIKKMEHDSLNGVFLIAGLRDSSNYYFVRLNSEGASFNQKYNGVYSHLKHDSSMVLKEDNWINLNITRDILKRTLAISYNGIRTELKDPNLVMGYIGLGVNGHSLSIDKMEVWAPAAISRESKMFKTEDKAK